MKNPEKEFANYQETQQHEAALKLARQQLEEAEARYQESLEKYHRLLEENKQFGPEVIDEASKEYSGHLKAQADNAWGKEQYDEAFAFIEKMRTLEKNYPEPAEVALTDDDERLIVEEAKTFYDALPEHLREGNFRFVANQFRSAALFLKKKGEAIDTKDAVKKISEIVKEKLESAPSKQPIAKAPFSGWNQKK
jgi:hypothetical protein